VVTFFSLLPFSLHLALTILLPISYLTATILTISWTLNKTAKWSANQAHSPGPTSNADQAHLAQDQKDK
jgi:hypothetical protein